MRKFILFAFAFGSFQSYSFAHNHSYLAMDCTPARENFTKECTKKCAGTKDVCRQSTAWIACKSDNPALLECLHLKKESMDCSEFKGEAVELDADPEDD